MKIKSSKMLSLQKVVYDEMKDKATVGVIHDDAAKKSLKLLSQWV